MQAKRHLGDDAERAFGADHQPGEIVARRGFARPPRGADDAAVGRHHAQATGPPRASCRSAPRWCPRRGSRPCRRSSHWRRGRSGRTGPWSRRCSLSCSRRTPAWTVQSKSSGIDREDRRPSRDRSRLTPPRTGGDIAFHRSAGAEGDDRHLLRRRTALHDRDHFLGRMRERPRRRAGIGGEMGLAAAMLEADRFAEVKAIADDGAKPGGEPLGQRPPAGGGGRAHDQNWKRTRAPTRRRSPMMPRSEAGRPASASVVFSM